MIKMIRTKAPSFLSTNKETWTNTFIKGAKFSWHSKQKDLLKLLKKMTLSHCAFCDDVLVPKGSEGGEVEHFKPKNKYKILAYEWRNLYPICSHCNQTKGDRFSEFLLKPDEKSYKFEDWFRIDPHTSELKPLKSNKNWERTEKTINLYGLNKEDKISRRLFEYDKIANNEYSNNENQPFRFIRKKIIHINKQKP